MTIKSKYATYGNLKHGMKGTHFYEVWKGMKGRCNNPNHVWFKNYGGKGITICKEWDSFEQFRDDLYASYLQHQKENTTTTLDRIDNYKGYSKENCRWATRKEQANNFRNNIYVEYKGDRKRLSEWSEITGISYKNLYQRIVTYKMNPEKAFTKINLRK